VSIPARTTKITWMTQLVARLLSARLVRQLLQRYLIVTAIVDDPISISPVATQMPSV
jgi:hypothetical protein